MTVDILQGDCFDGAAMTDIDGIRVREDWYLQSSSGRAKMELRKYDRTKTLFVGLRRAPISPPQTQAHKRSF